MATFNVPTLRQLIRAGIQDLEIALDQNYRLSALNAR